MSANSIVVVAFQVSLFVIVFGYGLRAEFTDLLYLFRGPGLLARSLLAAVVLMPAVAVVLARWFDFTPRWRSRLVALAISPLPPLLPTREAKAGGGERYGLGLVVVLAVLSIALVPLAAHLLGHVFPRSYVVSPVTVLRIMLISVFAPLVLGLATRQWLPTVARRLRAPVARAQVIFLPIALVLSVVSAGSALWQVLSVGTVLALTAFVAAGFAIGHALGGPQRETASVLGFSTACRHPATATAIASVNFPDRNLHGAVVLYVLLTVLIGLGYARWLRRLDARSTLARPQKKK